MFHDTLVDPWLVPSRMQVACRMNQRGKIIRRIWFPIRSAIRYTAVIAALIMIGGGIAVIYLDLPGPAASSLPLSVSYSCTKKAEIRVITVPVLEIYLETNGYRGIFEGDFYKFGEGRCTVYMDLPSRARSQPTGYKAATVMTKVPASNYVYGVVRRVPGFMDPYEMWYPFYVPGRFHRAGWGKTDFALPYRDTGLGSNGSTPLPEGTLGLNGMRESSALDLSVTCPEGMKISTLLPPNGYQTGPNTVYWHLYPMSYSFAMDQAYYPVYSGSCVNEQKRWLVDHVSDVIVLGSGAVLGVLVTLPLRKDGEGNTPANQGAATEIAPEDEADKRKRKVRFVFFLVLAFIAFVRPRRSSGSKGS